MPKSISLYIFLALVCEWALQHVPIVGLFMQIALAAAWSSFLVPALLLSIIIEAFIGAIPRYFIAIPAVALSGYYGAFAYQRLAITKAETELQASNPKFVTPFDPVTQSLVFEHGARNFANGHKIPMVYGSFEHSFNAYQLLPNSDCRALNAARHGRRHFWIQFRNWKENDAELKFGPESYSI